MEKINRLFNLILFYFKIQLEQLDWGRKARIKLVKVLNTFFPIDRCFSPT